MPKSCNFWNPPYTTHKENSDNEQIQTNLFMVLIGLDNNTKADKFED